MSFDESSITQPSDGSLLNNQIIVYTSMQNINVLEQSSKTNQLIYIVLNCALLLPGKPTSAKTDKEKEVVLGKDDTRPTVAEDLVQLNDDVTPDSTHKTGEVEDTTPEGTTDPRLQLVNGIGRTFTILKTSVVSMMRIPVKCNQCPILAVIDTAAEVTMISDRIFNALKEKHPILRNTLMYAAGRGMQMDMIIDGPLLLKIVSSRSIYCSY